MHRFTCLVVIGALAVAVWVVAAGPAAAAKGGNSDNAHVCQQGGHTVLTDTVGSTFKNAGDCASNGAKGNPYASSLSIVGGPTYPCASNHHDRCWGTVIGTGLATPVVVTVAPFGGGSPITIRVPLGASNSVNAPLELDCVTGTGAVVQGQATTTSETTILSDPVNVQTC